MRYDFGKIEKKWQKKWLEEKVFKADERSKKPKYYQLETFPYVSAAGLHVGHPKGYIGEDIHARYMRIHGREVLYTMGWDAFGLPTENYALKVGKSPKEVAEANVKNFKRQVQLFGLSYDWDREINTSSPDYYKWTQWLFIQLFKKGLAYRRKARVNWCPKDQTVLANEQVINGCCEQCGTPVEQKEMEQWFFKITDYAERLLKDLEGLDWPEATIKRQKDWVGKSEGALIKFQIPKSKFQIEVFTTRPDTLFGTTYMVLAPEHPLIEELKSQITNYKEIEKYIKQARHKTELQRQEEARDKTGVELKGVKAINPATKEEIPVWVADYVLSSYGTGAIMAVPAHDERDWEFAKKYNLPVREVIEPLFVKTDDTDGVRPNLTFKDRDAVVAVVKHWALDKYLCLKWKKTDWRGFIIGGIEENENMVEAAAREIREETGYASAKFVRNLGGVVHAQFYHAVKNENRWARFHGLYFELTNGMKQEIADEEKQIHDIVWVERKEVDRFLGWVTDMRLIWHRASNPTDFPGWSGIHESSRVTERGILTDSGAFSGMDSEKAKWEIAKFVGGKKQVHYKLRDWSVSRQRYWGVPIPMIHCAKCGIVPVPEEDLPVLLPALENYRPKGKPPLAGSEKFMKVKCPSCGGGAERDPETLDTFVDSSWYYLRYTDPGNDKEIFNKKKVAHWLPVDLYVIGAEHTVLHLLYSRFITKFLYDEGYLKFTEPFLKLRHQGLILGADGRKMSKRWGNVVNPDDLIKEFGADTVRLYEMFMGPFEEGQPWDSKGVLGTHRFLNRFWEYVVDVIASPHFGTAVTPGPKRQLIHKTIKKVGDDIANFRFNTAVSTLMILLNGLTEVDERGGVYTMLEPKDLEAILKLLAPFAPHITEEIWERLGNKTSIHKEKWPEYDPKLVEEETFDLVVEIDGKHRATILVSRGISEKEASKTALSDEKIKSLLSGVKIKKTIFVKDRLINFVI